MFGSGDEANDVVAGGWEYLVNASERALLLVQCPYCGAPKGVRCFTVKPRGDGRPTERANQDRRHAWSSLGRPGFSAWGPTGVEWDPEAIDGGLP